MKSFDQILLVDDDPIVNFYNEDLITSLNICNQVLCFENGKLAIDYLSSGNNSLANNELKCLLLLDINMPVMNGFEFLETYDTLPKENRVDIIICMLTTSLNKRDEERAQAFPYVSDYVSKPLNKEKMEEIIALSKSLIDPSRSKSATETYILDTEATAWMSAEKQHELLRMYLRTIDEGAKSILDAAKSIDLEMVGSLSHKLKGSSSSLHATELKEIFSEMEKQARAGEEISRVTLTRLQEAIERVKAVISNIVEVQ